VRLLPLPKAAHARLQIDMNLSLFWFPPYEEKVTRGKKGRKCENDQRELKCPLISFLRPKKPHQSLIVHQSLGVRTIEWRCNQKNMHGGKVQLLMEPPGTWPAFYKKSFKKYY